MSTIVERFTIVRRCEQTPPSPAKVLVVGARAAVSRRRLSFGGSRPPSCGRDRVGAAGLRPWTIELASLCPDTIDEARAATEAVPGLAAVLPGEAGKRDRGSWRYRGATRLGTPGSTSARLDTGTAA